MTTSPDLSQNTPMMVHQRSVSGLADSIQKGSLGKSDSDRSREHLMNEPSGTTTTPTGRGYKIGAISPLRRIPHMTPQMDFKYRQKKASIPMEISIVEDTEEEAYNTLYQDK